MADISFDDLIPQAVPSLDPKARELAIRTVLGEAAAEPDQGMAGVAAVIRNRLNAGSFGKDVPSVVLARNQFEPWMSQEGRNRMFGYAPESEPYRRAATAVDSIFGGGEDPTGGATHFFAPEAQAKLGRQPPSWAQGEPTVIGGHNFYGGKAKQADVSFDDLIPAAKPAAPTVAERSAIPEMVNPELQAGLQQRATQMTRGPQTQPAQQVALDYLNQGPAAAQGTTPNINAQQRNLVSTEVFESDSGELLYRDPSTGRVVPTDQNKQVVLRDPNDNTLKVYARTENTDEGRLAAAGRILGTGMGAGAVTARPGLPAVPKNIQPTASDVLSTAKPFYREFDAVAKGAMVDDPAGIVTRIKGALEKNNFTDDLAGEVHRAVERIDKGGEVDIAQLRNIKELVGKSSQSPDKRVRDAAGVASREINKVISELSPEAGQSLKTADQIFATSKSMQELQRKEAVADLRAGRAGYGGNAVNSMRQVLSPIVQKAVEGKSTGFKPDELAAMREIVEGTPATNALRGIGQLSPSKGIIQTVGAGGAVATLGPGAIAIPVLGAASNKLATVLTGKQIDRLKELVAKRSPKYAEAVQKATERWERAQGEVISNPSTNKFAGYLSASRSLSAGLQRDGVEVSVGDFIRMLQGPGAGRAEEDQAD